MKVDRSFIDLNAAATARTRRLGAELSPDEMNLPVGDHWTPAIAFAHLGFWDRRVMKILEMSEREGGLVAAEIDVVINDISLPLWAAVPPVEAVRLAIEASEALDARLEHYPVDLLQEIHDANPRWVFRNLHRNQHLDEVEAGAKAAKEI